MLLERGYPGGVLQLSVGVLVGGRAGLARLEVTVGVVGVQVGVRVVCGLRRSLFCSVGARVRLVGDRVAQQLLERLCLLRLHGRGDRDPHGVELDTA